MEAIKKHMKNKGVVSKRFNPKGTSDHELFGFFDEISNEYHDGQFSNYFRKFA